MIKNGSISTASVFQKSLVEQLNGSVPIAGSSLRRGRMGLSRLVLVGDCIFALGFIVVDTIPRCLCSFVSRLFTI